MRGFSHVAPPEATLVASLPPPSPFHPPIFSSHIPGCSSRGGGGGLILESNHLSLMQHGWYRRRSDSGIIYRVFLQRRGAEPTVAMAGVSLFPRHTKWIPRSPRERTRLRRHLKYLEFFAADTIFFVLFSVRISVFLFFAWETMFARENAYNP